MDTILSVLIVEDDLIAGQNLKQAITKHDDLKLVAATNNSKDAMRLTQFHLPNIVILDLELHHGGGNGLLYLSELRKSEISQTPYILVTTNNMSSVTLDQARLLGADFILAKYENGYSEDYVVENIHLLRAAILKKNAIITPAPDLTPAEREILIEKRIKRELDLVGINPKVKGYRYIIDAVVLIVNGSTEDFIKIIAQRYSKSIKSVERAMQNCIQNAWTNTPPDDLLQFYTARINSTLCAPTMMEFVFHYAYKIEETLKDRTPKE